MKTRTKMMKKMSLMVKAPEEVVVEAAKGVAESQKRTRKLPLLL